MFYEKNKLDGVKKTFLTIFSVAVLAAGFGALSAPEAEAAENKLTLTSTSSFLSMCKTNTINFTVKDGATLIDGAKVTLTGGVISECTTVAGSCSTPSTIIKGDVSVTVKKDGYTDGVLNFKKDNDTLRKGSTNEFISETDRTCYNECDDDLDVSVDCADSDCSGKTCYIGTQKGTCNSSTKKCDIPVESFSSITADKTFITVGVSTIINFTADANNVQVTLTGAPLGSSSPSCLTGSESPKKCSVTVTPVSSGDITFTAAKSGFTSIIKTIPVNASDALTISVSPSVTTMTEKISRAFDYFIVRDKIGNSVANANISFTGAGIDKNCTTDANGKCSSITLHPTSTGTITIKATLGTQVPGSIVINVVSAGSAAGGTGPGGLTKASVSEIINRMIAWLLGIAAGLATLFIIIGGVYYTTAAGDEEKITTAKKIITYSVLGLIFILISYSIVLTVNKIINPS